MDILTVEICILLNAENNDQQTKIHQKPWVEDKQKTFPIIEQLIFLFGKLTTKIELSITAISASFFKFFSSEEFSKFLSSS